MDYMKLRLSIYESYGNGEMTSDTCSHLIDHLDEKYGESIAEEAANAENDFINSSLKVFTESAGEDALTEAAKDFGAKIKAAWEKFKAWIKKIIEKILNLGKKPEQQKAEIKVSKPLDNALNDAKKWIAKLGGAKTAGAMAAAVAGIVSSTALIIKNRKLKETMGAKVYEYEKFKKEQADLVKQMQDAALKAQNEIADLKQDLSNEKGSIANAMDMAEKHFNELNGKLSQAKRELAAAQSSSGEKDAKIQDLQTKIKNLEKQLSEAKAKAKEAESSKSAASNNVSGEKVTDSKIISASTGLVNAVTQTVVSLLPQYSTKTTDDIDGKLSTRISKKGYIHLNVDDNIDMRVLKNAKINGYKSCKYIRESIKIILREPDPDIRNAWKKADYIENEINKNVYTIESTFRNKLESKYDFDSIDGIKSFANDYSSNSGEVGAMIKNALEEAKKVSSLGDKYKLIERSNDTKDNANRAVKDYRDAYQSYKITCITYDIIRDMVIDSKKRLHNIKEPFDD